MTSLLVRCLNECCRKHLGRLREAERTLKGQERQKVKETGKALAPCAYMGKDDPLISMQACDRPWTSPGCSGVQDLMQPDNGS